MKSNSSNTACAAAIQRAVQIDQNANNKLLALRLYEFGIRDLIALLRQQCSAVPDTSNVAGGGSLINNKLSQIDCEIIQSRCRDYIRRSLQIDKLILPNVRNSIERQHRINDGDTACSYDQMFGKYITDDVTDIFISESHLMAAHQIRNLQHFCELAARNSQALRYIFVVVRVAPDEPALVSKLAALVTKMQRTNSIELNIQTYAKQHDREILYVFICIVCGIFVLNSLFLMKLYIG